MLRIYNLKRSLNYFINLQFESKLFLIKTFDTASSTQIKGSGNFTGTKDALPAVAINNTVPKELPTTVGLNSLATRFQPVVMVRVDGPTQDGLY